jgi:hypothetical protein
VSSVRRTSSLQPTQSARASAASSLELPAQDEPTAAIMIDTAMVVAKIFFVRIRNSHIIYRSPLDGKPHSLVR